MQIGITVAPLGQDSGTLRFQQVAPYIIGQLIVCFSVLALS
jgi:hypothetical protein